MACSPETYAMWKQKLADRDDNIARLVRENAELRRNLRLLPAFRDALDNWDKVKLGTELDEAWDSLTAAGIEPE